jgi:predicted MFS family arabinose efflux permease
MPARPAPARRLAIVGAAALFTLWSTQYMAYMTWLPAFLVEAHGLDLRQAVLGYAVSPAIVIVFNLAGGWLLRRGAGLARVLLPALAVQALVWLLVPVTGSGWGGIASLVAYGAGTGLTPVCLFALPGALSGPGLDTARGFGVLMTGRNLGVLVGPLLLPPAIAFGGWDAVGPVFGAVTVAAFALAMWVTRAAARLAAT